MINYIQMIYGHLFTLTLLSLLSKLLVSAFQFNYLVALAILSILTFSLFQIRSAIDSESPFAFVVRTRIQ